MIHGLLKLRRSALIILLSYIGSVLIQFLGIYLLRNSISQLLSSQLNMIIAMMAVLFFISTIAYTCFAIFKQDGAIAVNLFFVMIKIGCSLAYIYQISVDKSIYYLTITSFFLFEYALNLTLEVVLKKNLLE